MKAKRGTAEVGRVWRSPLRSASATRAQPQEGEPPVARPLGATRPAPGRCAFASRAAAMRKFFEGAAAGAAKVASARAFYAAPVQG